FWTTAKAKSINGEAQIHAKVDGQKVIISEASIRRDLQFADEEGVDCLPNDTIFEQLALIRCQDTIEDTIAQTRSERVSKLSNDSLLIRGNTLQSDEDRLKLNELMELCTTLQSRVLDLENTKTTQALEIDSLKKRVKKLEKKQRSRTHKLKRLYMVGLSARVESFDDNEDLGEDASKQGRKIHDIDADEDINLVNDQDDEKNVQKVVEEEVKDINTAKLIIDVAQVNAVEEQQELTDKEKATLLMKLLEKRRKFFASKRADEKRNKPPAQAQQRKIMCTYLKNMEGKKLKDLKNKSFDSIQKMFDRAFKRVNTFVDYKTELVEESSKKTKAEVMERSSKRADTELEQESSKKQKIDDDKEIAELKQFVKIIPDEEGVAIDAIPLAVKPPSIIDWKIHKEGKKSCYQIIKAD
nr:hypothetical protein [Tanacetum cinerariifolium]